MLRSSRRKHESSSDVDVCAGQMIARQLHSETLAEPCEEHGWRVLDNRLSVSHSSQVIVFRDYDKATSIEGVLARLLVRMNALVSIGPFL